MAYYKCGSIYTTQNSNVVVDTSDGAIANFNTPLALPLIETKFGVKATQDLNGQSGPYPAGGGINKWDEEWESGGISDATGIDYDKADTWRTAGYIPILPNTSYYICSPKGVSGNTIRARFYDSDKNYIGYSPASGNCAVNRSFVSPSSAAFLRFNPPNETCPNHDISVNYPSTDTEYHPYSNICMISGASEISLVKCGKNLFDGVSIVYGYPLNSIIEAGSFMRIVFSRCKPNTKYTISKIQSQRFSVFWCEDLPAIGVSILSPITNNFATSMTVTTGATARYICAFVYNQNVDTLTPEEILSSVQIEENASATSFEPFNSNTEVINLGGTYYGGHFTQDKDGKRKFVVTHEKATYNLADHHYTNENGFDEWIIYRATRAEQAPNSPTGKLCNCCPEYKYADVTLGRPHYYISAGAFVMYLPENIYRNGYLEYTYPLETPYTIDLPDGTPIKSLPGVNNIFADTGDTAVKFRKIGD